MVTTFGDYNKMTVEELQKQKMDLQNSVNGDHIGYMRAAGATATGAVQGALVGTAAGVGAFMVQNRQILDRAGKIFEDFSKTQGAEKAARAATDFVMQNAKGRLAVVAGAVAAVGAALYIGRKAWKERAVEKGVENESRLSHVERLLQERQQHAVTQQHER